MDLETATSILCFQCGKLYVSIFNEGNDENRDPVIGSCLHSICVLCFSALGSPDCPICEKKDAFRELIMNESGLETLRTTKELIISQDNTENFQKIKDIRERCCTSCEQHNQTLHFCKTCVETATDGDYDYAIMKHTSTGECIILPSMTVIHLFCDNCLITSGEHEKHEQICIDNVVNMEETVSMNAMFSILNFKKSGYQNVLEYFKKAREDIKLVKNLCEGLEEEHHCCHIFKRKIRFDLRNLAFEHSNLKKRGVLLQKERLRAFITFYEDRLKTMEVSDASCRLQDAVNGLRVIFEDFEAIPEDWLASEEIEKIDTEVVKRMTHLEDEYKKESFIQKEEITGYFKYHAVINEMKHAHDDMIKAYQDLERNKKSFEEYKAEQQQMINEWNISEESLEAGQECSTGGPCGELEIYMKHLREIISMDRSAERFKIDKQTLECGKTCIRKQYAELMVLEYFPKAVESKVLDFFSLIQEFKSVNKI